MARVRRTVAVDIGSTKVACLVAETDRAGKTTIVGFGRAGSEGFKQGMVVNLDKAAQSVQEAAGQCEEMVGGRFRAHPALVGMSGEHVKHLTGTAAVPVRKPSRGIGPRDVEDVIKQAQTVRLPSDEQILHVVPTQFIVDGQKGVRNPLGLFGVRLEVEALLIIGAVTAIENIYRVMERLEIRNRSLVLQSVASLYGVGDDEDKELGVVLVDLGGVTDVSVYREGEIRFTKLLPVGAVNITKDVVIGLRTNFTQAEELKRKHGVAMASLIEKDEAISVEDASGRGPKQVSRRLLASVIQPRVEEILTLADAEVRKSGYGEGLSAGVVLTGGGSSLSGIDLVAEQIFGMPVRLGRPDRLEGPQEVTKNPGFATAVGLIRCGVEGKATSQFPSPGFWSNVVDGVGSWFSS
ncbi:cell division protein FtsA [candidate division WOR-3 bacterium]|nr:cell division protein FtsA [candidate division WOR-3 bacterium]